MRGATIMAATCLGLAPGAAAACVIELTQCRTEGGTAHLYDHAGPVVLFSEWRDDGGPSRSVMVECTSRSGVMVVDDPDNYTRLQGAETYFRQVMFDDTAQTLDQVVRHLRGQGIPATRVRLSPEHCGCDLPNMPPPDNYCPDF